jgi:hypothetical protein
MAMSALGPTMQFVTFLMPLHELLACTVGREQLHALPSITFNFSHQRVDIVLTKDGICTLVKVVIANPTHADLLSQSCTIQGFTTFDATQAKERSYHNQHPTNQFLPLTIEIFGCLHNK